MVGGTDRGLELVAPLMEQSEVLLLVQVGNLEFDARSAVVI